MHWFWVWYYRYVDSVWSKPVALGDRDEIDAGEWNRTVGETGEDLARRWLWARGKKILYRRYRAKDGGEVDIVFRDRETLVFCEVKTRTSLRFGRPASAVDRKKRRLITRGANAWIQELGYLPLVFRFDIVEVVLIEGELPEVQHIENAFQAAPRIFV